MPPDLSASLQQYLVPAIGVAATVMGFTGIVRHETGALNESERHTALGRILTPILSAIWLLAGIAFLISRIIPPPLRDDIVGYTAISATILFLATLAGTLIVSLSMHGRRFREPTADGSPIPAHTTDDSPTFNRYDAVTHPTHGYGRVLYCYFVNDAEMVSVRFWREVHTVPASTLKKERLKPVS